MTPKDWLSYLVSELPPERFPRSRAHFSNLVGPVKEVPQRMLTTAVAAGVRVRIMERGGLPSGQDLKTMILDIGGSMPDERPAGRSPSQFTDENEKLKHIWLDFFRNRIAEGVQGQEIANLVSLVRSQSPGAYDAIAEQHDHARWQEERRRAADIMQRRHQMEQVAQQARRRMAIPPPQSYESSAIPQQPKPQHTVKRMTPEQLDRAYRERHLTRPGPRTVESERLD